MKRRFFDGLKGVFRIGRSATGNETAASEEALEFKYTQQYFDYHRNMTLSFLACISVTWAGLVLEVDKIAYVTGDTLFIRRFLPPFLWAMGTYNLILYIPEWFACASPHWMKVRSVTGALTNAISDLSGACRELSATMIGSLTRVEETRSFDSIARVRSAMSEVRRSALSEFDQEARERLKYFRHNCDEIIRIIDISTISIQNNNDIFAKIDKFLHFMPDDHADEFDAAFSELKNHFQEASFKFMEIISQIESEGNRIVDSIGESNARQSRNVILEDSALDIFKASDDILSNIEVCCDKIQGESKEIERLVRLGSINAGVLFWVPWIKVYLGGVVFPIILLFISLFGVIEHLQEKPKEFPSQFCPFDLTINKQICEISTHQMSSMNADSR